jgi:hypothetical protein
MVCTGAKETANRRNVAIGDSLSALHKVLIGKKKMEEGS